MEKTFRENLFAFVYFLRHFCNIPKKRERKKTFSIFSPFDRLNRTSPLKLTRDNLCRYQIVDFSGKIERIEKLNFILAVK